MGGLDSVGPPLLVLALVLVGWQALVVATDLPAVILPSPLGVARALILALPLLLGDAAVTGATALLGLAVGVVVGLLLAFVVTASRRAAAVVGPTVVALRIVPLVAVGPLVFLWLGDGLPARAVLVATMTVFPVTIAAAGGLRSVPTEYLDLADSVGAPARRTSLRVRLPAAAPSVFAGIKLAAVLSVVGTVIAEFLALRAGLGYRVLLTSRYLRTARTFAALVVLAALGVAFYLAAAAVERRFAY